MQCGPVSVRRLGTEHRRQRRSGAHSFASLSPGWLSVWVLLFLTSLAPLRLCYWKSLRPTHGGEPVRSGRQATGRLSEQAGRDSGWFAGEEGPLQSVPKGIAPVLLPQGGPAQGALVLDPTAPGRRPQEARKACTVAGPGGPAPGAMRPVLDLGDSRTQLPGGENLCFFSPTGCLASSSLRKETKTNEVSASPRASPPGCSRLQLLLNGVTAPPEQRR